MAQKLNIDIVAKDKSKQALTGVRGGLDRLKKSVFSLQSAFIGLGAGLAIKSLVNTGKQIEGLQVRLKFLFGTAQEGAKAFDEMAKFAARVPFSLEEIQAGSGVLAVVSKDAKELANLMEITGNVAAVTGLDFKTTAEQIQRSMSAGISAADLFRDRGVKSMLGFKAGAVVTVEETAAAFTKIFGKGGKFGGATDELAKTFEGTLSMIGDKFFNFKRTLLDAGFFAELKSQFGDLNIFFEENAKTFDELAISIGRNLADGLIVAAKAVKLLADNFRDLQSVLGIVLVALGGVLKIIVGAALIIDDINKRFDKLAGVTEKIKVNLNALYDDMPQALKEVKKEAEEIDTFLRSYENELGIKIPSATEKAISKFREMNDGAIQDFEKKMSNIKMTIAEGINNGITTMSQGIARAVVFGEKLSDTLKNMAQQFLSKIISQLIEVVARKGVELAIEKLITNEKRKQAALSSVSGGGSIFSAFGSFFGGGKKASGGAVSKGQPYMVGEQGAELFVPNQSGQIQQNARGGSVGGSTTVNFNINAVDASGFEELLVRSRGTITQLINNAVNERGSKNLI